MDFAQVIKDRYSYKKYDGKPVTAEQLSSILEAGRLAPTAKNLQEQHIYVVQSAEGLAKIDKLTPCRYGAPTVLVVAFNKDSVFTITKGEAKQQSVKINRVESLGNNNYYKVTGSVSGEKSCKKVVAVVQKNRLDTELGFSIKALKWS